MADKDFTMDDSEEKEELVRLANDTYNIELTNSIRNCMIDRDAKRFIREILSWCCLYDSVNPNEEKVLHAEGRRLIGVQIKNVLDNIDTEFFHELMLEGARYEKQLFDETSK